VRTDDDAAAAIDVEVLRFQADGSLGPQVVDEIREPVRPAYPERDETGLRVPLSETVGECGEVLMLSAQE
jgi:hypothetical protein